MQHTMHTLTSLILRNSKQLFEVGRIAWPNESHASAAYLTSSFHGGDAVDGAVGARGAAHEGVADRLHVELHHEQPALIQAAEERHDGQRVAHGRH